MSALEKIMAGGDLSAEEAEGVMERIMGGECPDAEIAGILVGLKMKRESPEEIASFAKVMRKRSVRIKPKVNGRLVDTCGTGGDGTRTFNISTTAAFIAAGAGVSVAKHGNRSVSSKSGSADLLEELGAKMLPPEKVEECMEKVGFGFMFAPFFHPAMKNVMGARKALGVRTVFNILGPLTNPANAEAQVLGVYDPELTEVMAGVLGSLGTKHALVVHSEGMDELGLGESRVTELRGEKIETYALEAGEVGLEKGEVPRCESREESAGITRKILGGEKGAGRDIAVLNAAAAIYVSGKAGSVKEGVEIAGNAVDSGAAGRKLEEFVKFGVD